MALLDAYGRPVRQQQLTERLAEPGVTGIRRAWADSVASGLTPLRLARVLRAAADGDLYDYLTLAEEMEEKDLHYASVLGIRKRAISGLEPRVEAASESAEDKKIAQAVKEHIAEHDDLADLSEDMLDALGKGFSVTEIDWDRSRREWWPGGFSHVDPRWITVDRATGKKLRLLDDEAPTEGLELAPFKFVQHRARLKSGLPGRQGLARLVSFTWMCKAYTAKDWMAFVETYGLPLRLGRYGPAAKPEDVEVLFRAVANIGTDAAAVLPESMRIDFEQAASGQGNDIFERLARWGDEQISKAVLGQTMTSDNGSSEAQAKVHNEVRLDIAQSDAKKVSGAINRDLVRPFVDLNFGRRDVYPRLILEVDEPEDTDLILRNASELIKLGLAVRASELRQKLGFSDPDKKDEVIGGPAPVPADPLAANRETPPPAALGDPAEEVDALEAELAGEWREVMEGALEPLLTRLEAAEDYDEARRIVADAYPTMDNGVLIEQLVMAMVKARAVGEARDG